jgi:hypothetical protein
MSIASTRIAAPDTVGRSSIANGLPASLTIRGAGEIPDSHRWDSSPKIRFAADLYGADVIKLKIESAVHFGVLS